MYGKIFASMYEGSLYGHWQAIVTFQQLIVICDPDGIVDMTPAAISGRTSIPLEIIEKGIEELSKPDHSSRSDDEEGRRIVPTDPSRPWGWKIVNHAYYRDLIKALDKRVADRERIAGKRAVSRDVANRRTSDSYSDADSYSDSESPTDSVELVFRHWTQVHGHPKAQLDDKRRSLIRKALGSYSEADLCLAITGYLNSPHHMGENDRATKYDDIEIFLRDAKHIDAGIRFHAEPPRTDLSSLTRRNLAATDGWLPPELRKNGTD